jgi:hypothetical protein
MKIRILAGVLFLAVLSAGATAEATIVTTGAADFHGLTATDQASLQYGTGSVKNIGTQTVTVIATIKRTPASSGSQTVTIEGYNDDGGELEGVLYSINNFFGAVQTFFVSPGADYFSLPVTFTAAEVPSTVFFYLQIELPPGSFIGGAYVN